MSGTKEIFAQILHRLFVVLFGLLIVFSILEVFLPKFVQIAIPLLPFTIVVLLLGIYLIGTQYAGSGNKN